MENLYSGIANTNTLIYILELILECSKIKMTSYPKYGIQNSTNINNFIVF